MIYTPLNGITWTIGSLPTFLFGIKALRSYSHNSNPLARIYGWLGITLGTCFLFFGLPALMSNNVHILKYTYFGADLFAQLSLQVQTWLLWFIGMRTHISLRKLLMISVPFSAVLLTLQFMHSHVALSYSPYFVHYIDKPIVLTLKSIIYIVVPWPLGYFFFRQIPNQVSLGAKAKALITGGLFILISSFATANNIFDKGSDTPSSSSILMIAFLVFLVVAFVPSRQDRQITIKN